MSGAIKQSAVCCRGQRSQAFRAGVRLIALMLAGLPALAWAQASGAVVPMPEPVQLCYERLDIQPWRTLDGRGLNIELIRLAAARAGIPVQFVTLPWKRCLSEMRDGAVHGVFAASFLPERLAFGAYPGGNPADPSMQLYADGYTLVRRKGDPIKWDGKHLTGLNGPVGVQIGYSVAHDLRKMGVSVDEGSQSAKELLQKLQLGRLGAAAMGNSDAQMLLGDATQPGEFAATTEALPVPLVQKAYYLMLSHQFVQDTPFMANKLWQGIAVARRSPEYQKLVREVASGRKP